MSRLQEAVRNRHVTLAARILVAIGEDKNPLAPWMVEKIVRVLDTQHRTISDLVEPRAIMRVNISQPDTEVG